MVDGYDKHSYAPLALARSHQTTDSPTDRQTDQLIEVHFRGKKRKTKRRKSISVKLNYYTQIGVS